MSIALAVLFFGVLPAAAALTEAQLGTIAAAPVPAAHVPLDLGFADQTGKTAPLTTWIDGRPALLVLSDFRCTQLCGPILSIAARALAGTGLVPDRDFTLLVIGFNPEAGQADGDALRVAQLSAFPELDGKMRILTGTTATVDRLERAIGFSAIYDSEAGRFAHPADLYVLTPRGAVSRVLNGLSAEPDTVRLALVEASQGRIGTLADHLHILCYGLDPAAGIYDVLVGRALKTGAGVMLAGFGVFALLFVRRRKTGDAA